MTKRSPLPKTTEDKVTDPESVKTTKSIKENNMNATVSAINSTLTNQTIGDTKFLVLKDIKLSQSVESTWIKMDKFFDIIEYLENKKTVSYIVRNVVQANLEKGIKAKNGKALQFIINEKENIVTALLRTSTDNKKWDEKYTYTIPFEIFQAYKLVSINDKMMQEQEHVSSKSNIIELN